MHVCVCNKVRERKTVYYHTPTFRAYFTEFINFPSCACMVAGVHAVCGHRAGVCVHARV